ncbi:MAG: hypothetical protein IPL73_06020 [Candidatus Obscuribacter sp.]|nr:hypothetical protein [Candidatus Obscuribacter sp.]
MSAMAFTSYTGLLCLSMMMLSIMPSGRLDLIINVGHDVVEKPPFIMTVGGTKVLHINFSSVRVDDAYFAAVRSGLRYC